MDNYRKKPVVIQAILWDGEFSTIKKFIPIENASEPSTFDREKKTITIHTLEGDMTANLGDWIIRGVNGEIYPCKPDIFEKTYEKV